VAAGDDALQPPYGLIAALAGAGLLETTYLTIVRLLVFVRVVVSQQWWRGAPCGSSQCQNGYAGGGPKKGIIH
jgi:hypothetical protein